MAKDDIRFILISWYDLPASNTPEGINRDDWCLFDVDYGDYFVFDSKPDLDTINWALEEPLDEWVSYDKDSLNYWLFEHGWYVYSFDGHVIWEV